MAWHKVAVVAKDGAGNSITGGIQQHDTSGTGAGPNDPLVGLIDSTGAEVFGAVTDSKSASTDSTAVSAISIWKQISYSIQAVAAGVVALGTNVMANSMPVTVATDDTVLGATSSAAPASDTATANINGRLQRVAQNITSLISYFTTGLTPYGQIINSAPATNATFVKAAAAKVYRIEIYNQSGTGCWLKVYDKASAPTIGTDTPKYRIFAPAGGGAVNLYETGATFLNGIAYYVSGLLPDNDTTALASSTQISVNISYK